ncbi:hypothetical protein X798_00877 [Onchocerca flexuosa]|uniref:Uncharacterized protein n=1 Tax=Onchocerca flexuosa TaxID=387005 RepID=A0A238C5C9_9BILA|nr:hypothetical protein X798_00877 [Onchocerca flexuosa]
MILTMYHYKISRELILGRIGERLVTRTTTLTGQRLQYTVTRPFILAKPELCDLKCYRKCCSDFTYENTMKDFTENQSTTIDNLTNETFQSSSSIDSSDFFDKKGYKIFTESLSSKIFGKNKGKVDVKLISSKHQNPSIDKNNRNAGCCSFARRFREMQRMNFGSSKKLSDRSQSEVTSTVPSVSTVNSKIIANSTNNIDKNSSPTAEESRQQIKKHAVFYEQSKSLSPSIIPTAEESRQQIKKHAVFYEQSKSLSPSIINEKGMS